VLQIGVGQCIIVVLGVTKKIFCIMYFPVLVGRVAQSV
jgi:hypothetical protein